MTETVRFGNSILLRPEEMADQGIVQEAIKELRISMGIALAEQIQDGNSYIVKLTTQQERTGYPYPGDKVFTYLDVRPVPVERIEFFRDIRLVTVDSLCIEAINCKNCGAPIPVGTLDRRGDTLVRCSYCGTYHTIRKRG